MILKPTQDIKEILLSISHKAGYYLQETDMTRLTIPSLVKIIEDMVSEVTKLKTVATDTKVCPDCHGRGMRYLFQCGGEVEGYEHCDKCDGAGMIYEDKTNMTHN